MRHFLHIGDHRIMLDDPQPDQIDLTEIDNRLRIMRRWSNNPKALTVDQHRRVVWGLANWCGAAAAIQTYCWHHDDHEAIIGDIPGPVLKFVCQQTLRLTRLASDLDRAIYGARGIRPPTIEERAEVDTFDKGAETLEWLFVLRELPQAWNAPVPGLSGIDVPRLLRWAVSGAPQEALAWA